MKCTRKSSKQLQEELERAYKRISELEKAAAENLRSGERSNEQLLRLVLDNIPFRIFWKDRDSNYLGCNLAFARDAGLKSTEEIIGRNDYTLSWSEHADLYRSYDREVLETGNPRRYFIHIKNRTDKSLICLRTSKMPLLDENGNRSGILGIYEDMPDLKLIEEELERYRERLEAMVKERTIELEIRNAQLEQEIARRKNAENALSESEEKYRLHFFDSNDVMVYYDDTLQIRNVSPNVERLLGFRPEELTGRNFPDLGILFPGDVEKAIASAREVLSGQTILWNVYRFITKSGEVRFGEVSGIPLFRDGLVTGVISVIRDITKRINDEKQLLTSEQRFKMIAETITEVFWIRDLEKDSFIYISPGYERIWGCPRSSLYENPHSFLDSIHQMDRERVELERRTRERQGLPFNTEYRIVMPDGSIRWIWDRGFPAADGNGRTANFVGVAQDITERKLAEKEKKRIELQLVQIQKMEALGRFAGGIAHDLNNVLYPIIIDLEMILEETIPNTQFHQVLREVLNAVYRQRDLVKQILSFSRKSEQKFNPVKVAPLIRETLHFIRSSLPITIALQYRIDAHTDTILSDATQIQQIIMNLCRNAADALGPQEGTIEIVLSNLYLENMANHPDLKSGEYLQLTVSDTGCGISPDIMDRIFEPFFTTKEPGKGCGIGLSVVHGILKDHGGAITVESEPGKGSRFTVYLPSCTQTSQARLVRNSRDKSPKGDGKILLVDDEDMILSSLESVLKRSGYQVVTSNDSQQALALFNQDPEAFDLVITDLTMPKMSGKDLVVRLMQARSTIPVILCTGFSDIIDEAEARALGIREILMKPAGTSELDMAIRRALGKQQTA